MSTKMSTEVWADPGDFFDGEHRSEDVRRRHLSVPPKELSGFGHDPSRTQFRSRFPALTPDTFSTMNSSDRKRASTVAAE